VIFKRDLSLLSALTNNFCRVPILSLRCVQKITGYKFIARCVYVCIYTNVYACMEVAANVVSIEPIYTLIHIYMGVCLCLYVYVYMYIYIYICIYIYIYI